MILRFRSIAVSTLFCTIAACSPPIGVHADRLEVSRADCDKREVVLLLDRTTPLSNDARALLIDGVNRIAKSEQVAGHLRVVEIGDAAFRDRQIYETCLPALSHSMVDITPQRARSAFLNQTERALAIEQARANNDAGNAAKRTRWRAPRTSLQAFVANWAQQTEPKPRSEIASAIYDRIAADCAARVCDMFGFSDLIDSAVRDRRSRQSGLNGEIYATELAASSIVPIAPPPLHLSVHIWGFTRDEREPTADLNRSAAFGWHKFWLGFFSALPAQQRNAPIISRQLDDI